MSRIFEALNRLKAEDSARIIDSRASASLDEISSRSLESVESKSVWIRYSPKSRLVALTDANGLGAEKFRALVTRLDDMAKQQQLRSFQVTSSVINDGKTIVAGNVAITLAKYCGSRTLLVEGDLHRPTLAGLFGLDKLCGVRQWWAGQALDLTKFVHKLKEMPLWFLPAGTLCDRPSDILRSPRFVSAFQKLASQFDWIVVDSTPMLPIVDVNLWSKLVDGTLLVVREGHTPVKALKNGLQALDRPNLIGVVINEASVYDQGDYYGKYYGSPKTSIGAI